MNIIFTIGIFLLASSFIMVAYVWIKDHFRKKNFIDIEVYKNDLLTEEKLIKEDIAA